MAISLDVALYLMTLIGLFYAGLVNSSPAAGELSEEPVVGFVTSPNVTEMSLDNKTGDNLISIQVIQINFEEVKMPILICVVVLLAALSKIAFHHVKWLSSRLPESCLLIVVGVILGSILYFSGLSAHLPHFFEPHEFFLYLLPPIILEAAFSLHDRVVFNNIGSILTFAVIGTVLACFAVGYTMYGLAKINALGNNELGAAEILIFSSLIVAVDPVAVLAVFEEVGVNNVLYFMVFGESLLNDGVTVVLYHVMHDINAMDHVDATQIVLGVVTFLVVVGGGVCVGIIMGLISAIVTKYTNSVRVVEPMAVFIFAYMSFLVADAFTLSGIISMIACGVIQMKYTFRNITPKSSATIKYFTKVLSTATEIVIFLFLGLSLVRSDHDFQVGFILWAIFLTLVYRFIITYGLTFLLNKDRYRVRKITLQEQFIISYGGLRGAVAFSLVGLLKEGEVQRKQLFVTATLAVIIFTVFVQGITIKPLVKLFKVRMASTDESTLFQEVMDQMTDHVMSGLENITGYRGNYRLKACLEFYEDKYLKRWLLKNPDEDEEIMRRHQKVLFRDHLNNLHASGARIPNSPAVVRAMTPDLRRSDGDGNDVFFKADESDVSSQRKGITDIELGTVTRRPRRAASHQTASMTPHDMIRLLSTQGRNTMHRFSEIDDSIKTEPDLLHHLKGKHKRVTELQREAIPEQSGQESGFDRHGSWHGARSSLRVLNGIRHNLPKRPLSANIGHSEFLWGNYSGNSGNPTEGNTVEVTSDYNGGIASRNIIPNDRDTSELRIIIPQKPESLRSTSAKSDSRDSDSEKPDIQSSTNQ